MIKKVIIGIINIEVKMIKKDGTWLKRISSSVIVLVLVLSGLLTQVTPVQAAAITLQVDTTVDDPAKTACTAVANDCSLRGAISHINATITLPSPDYQILLGANTYTLTTHGAHEDANATGDIDITYPGYISIEGTDAMNTIIDGDSADRVFESHAGMLTLYLLTVTNGTVTGPSEDGGGILGFAGTTINLLGVTLDSNTSSFYGGGLAAYVSTVNIAFSTIGENSAPNGGGLYTVDTDLYVYSTLFTGNSATSDAGGGLLASSTGLTQIYNSIFENNHAGRGGAIFNGGDNTMTIQDSILRGNSATSSGGVESYGDFTMERSEVSGNTMTGGIAMSFQANNFSLKNVTIANNSSVGASAIFTSNGTTPTIGTLDHVTITGNTSTGGGASVFIYSGSVRVMNSIINNTDGNAACEISTVDATLTSFNYNIASDATCNLVMGNDHPNTNPNLRSLGNYGGFSYSAPPLYGSAAIDSANPAFAPGDTDQRGINMVDGDVNSIVVPDIGASEFLPPAVYFPLMLRP
jgi:hypothetical protein